ncbi:MAG: hypothetical protein ABSC33_08200 [Candidatus Sulfotelmatobacter sp.]|jgi:hypothetical protein
MNRPTPELKAAANRMATLLASSEGHEVLAALARFDVRLEQTSIGPASDTTRVGIWEKTIKRGETVFVRRAGVEPWSLWAQVGTIPLRPQAQRVVFLGESVARGYFYDPYFNPAQALQAMLRSSSGAADIDVIDLARVGIERKQMLELVASSLALDPSALVIFAGNNWHPTLSLSPTETAEAADLLRTEESWQAVKAFMESKLRTQVQNFLCQVAGITCKRHIPVILIIPEFNLRDWRDRGSPPPIFDSAQNADWIAARTRLEELQRTSGWDEIESLAKEMVDLDGNTSPLSLYARADRAINEGDYRAARSLLEKARDAGCSLPQVESPRCYSIVQETIRSEGARYEFAVVDLPVCFDSHLEGALPGRSLFHDYCHLTVEGICVAMAATARALQTPLGLPSSCDVDLMHCVTRPNSTVAAEACFLAAVHNANWGQPQDIVEYYCREALEHSKEVSELMQWYLDSHLRQEPASMCASFNKAIERQSLSATNILFTPPRRRKALNLAIVAGIAKTLAPCQPGKVAEIARLLKREHSVDKGAVNLLDRRYCAVSSANLEGRWDERWAYYRAFDNCSRFTLIADGPHRVVLHLVYRTRKAADLQPVTIKVNGCSIAMAPPSQCWSHFRTEADICDGINTVEVSWPAAHWCRKRRADEGARCLEAAAGKSESSADIMPAIYPVYGELYSFEASAISSGQGIKSYDN